MATDNSSADNVGHRVTSRYAKMKRVRKSVTEPSSRPGPSVRIFGEVGVEDSGASVSIGGTRQRRLLALLAVRAGSVVSLDWLAEHLWDDGQRPKAYETRLRTYLSRLRQALPKSAENWIETAPQGYCLVAPPESVEHRRFALLRSEAMDARERGDPLAAFELLDEALSLWRGDPFRELEDLDWARTDIEQLHLDRLEMREERWETELALGRHTQITGELAAFVDEHALRDRAVRQYALALHRSGRTPEGLRVIAHHRSELVDQTGLDPSPAVVTLERLLIDGDRSLDVEKVGRPLRGYRLLEEKAAGAFAVVWKGVQPSVGRDVAIKQIRAEFASRPEFIRRFEAEAHMVARIEHPHVVPLIDFWRDPESAYLVMRWLGGGTLERRLDDGPLSVGDTLALAHQIGGALSAAHAQGVVHRDVKAANILFDESGNAFLGDFGIALETSESSGPEAAISPGSPIYAAPEQIRREPLGPEADLFSLGVVLFECLTGSVPFPVAASIAEVIDHQLNTPFPSVSELCPTAPAAISDAVARATAKDPAERFSSVADFLEALDAPPAALSRDPISDSADVVPVSADLRNPYLGLRAFDSGDAERFFGRERLVDELLARLAGTGVRSRCLVVVGPSGSGKSSVVRAGLIPALRRGEVPDSEKWFVTTFVPGASPFESLEAALLRIAVNPPPTLLEQLRDGPRGILRGVRRCLGSDEDCVVVVIDQFEETFIGQAAADADEFLEALSVAVEDPNSPLRLLVTLRADYYDRPLEHPAFAPIVKEAAVEVTPLAPDEIVRAIVEPATDLGLHFESGLVVRIAAETVGQPSPLPMLQYTLHELFERRRPDSNTLDTDAYDSVGGITGALAARAEAIYGEADAEQRGAVRRMFGRMTNPAEESAAVRRRVPIVDLGDEPATAWVLDRFGVARLLTSDRDPTSREPTVEVAHEALLREWPRLAGWLDEDRGLLRSAEHVAAAAAAWDVGGRAATDLYRGGRLESAVELASTSPQRLRTVDHNFIGASLEAAAAERRAEQRRVHRLRRLVVGTAVALVVAVVAGGIAVTQQRRADDEAQAAQESASDADVQRQAAEAAALNADTQRQAAEEAALDADTQRLTAEEQTEVAQGATATAELASLIGQSAAARVDDPDLSLLLALEADRRSPGAETKRVVLDRLAGLGSQVSGMALLDESGCSSDRVRSLVGRDGRTDFGTVAGTMRSKDLITGAETDHGLAPVRCVGWVGDEDANARWVWSDGFSNHWFGPLDGPLVSSEIGTGGPLGGAFVGSRLTFAFQKSGSTLRLGIVDAVTGEEVGRDIPDISFAQQDLPSVAGSTELGLFALAVSLEFPTTARDEVVVLDASTGAGVFGIEFPGRVTNLAFDDANRELLVGGGDGVISIIGLETQAGVGTVSTTSSSEIVAVGVRPDGLIVAVSLSRVELLDRRRGLIGSAPVPIGVTDARVRPDGTVVLIENDERFVVIDLDSTAVVDQSWDVDASALVGFGAGQASAVHADGHLEMIDLETGEPSQVELVTSAEEPSDIVGALPEDDGILAWSDDTTLGRWVGGEMVENLPLYQGLGSLTPAKRAELFFGANHGGFVGTGAMLAFSVQGASQEAYLYDTRPGFLGLRLRIDAMPRDNVSAAPTLSGGMYLISSDGRVRTHDSAGKRTSEIETGMLGMVATSVDQATGLLALGGAGGVAIVDPTTSDVAVVLGVDNAVSVGFVRDGELLVIVEQDGTVRLWDVARGESIGVLWAGLGSASASPPWYDATTDSVWVATSGKLLRFPLDPDRWVEKACELVGRSLTQDEWTSYVPGDGPPQSACA